MSDSKAPEVDMSPAAVFTRLREASDLLELCLQLGNARRIGPVAELEGEARAVDLLGSKGHSVAQDLQPIGQIGIINGIPVIEHLDNTETLTAWMRHSGIPFNGTRRPERLEAFVVRILEILIRCQADFFLRGLDGLRPLSQREVAQQAQVNESTVSRMVSRLKLRFRGEDLPVSLLFATGAGDTEPLTASPLIKLKLLRVLSSKPDSSDEDIVRELEARGVTIARRTAAKYREDLGIPSTWAEVDRRVALQLALQTLAPPLWLRQQLEDLTAATEPPYIHAPETGPSNVSHEPPELRTSEFGVPSSTEASSAIPSSLTAEGLFGPTVTDSAPPQRAPDWQALSYVTVRPSESLPFGLVPAGPLLPHQDEAIVNLTEWWNESLQPGVLCLPTGAGKTRTAVSFILRKVIPKRVLWLAHRVELIEQAFATFLQCGKESTGRYSVGRFQRTVKSSTPCAVIIASIPTLARRHRDRFASLRRLLALQTFDLVVVDECHHGVAATWQQLLEALCGDLPRMRLLGLSATPTRSSKREQPALWRLFGSIIHEAASLDLISRSVLARPEIVCIGTNSVFDATEKERAHFSKFKDLAPTLVNRIAMDGRRNELIVKTYLGEPSRWGQSLIFCSTIDQAQALTSRLRSNSVSAAAVYGSTSDIDRSRVLTAFRKGDIKVLINVGLFSEGTDVPGLDTVFIARPTKSRILFQQMVGRAMRGPLVGGSEKCTVVSFFDHIKGLMTEQLASCFSAEQEALAALGLDSVQERDGVRVNSRIDPSSEGPNIDAYAEGLRVGVENSHGVDHTDLHSDFLAGWWEAVYGEERSFLPIYSSDKEFADYWIGLPRSTLASSRPEWSLPIPDLVWRRFHGVVLLDGASCEWRDIKSSRFEELQQYLAGLSAVSSRALLDLQTVKSPETTAEQDDDFPAWWATAKRANTEGMIAWSDAGTIRMSSKTAWQMADDLWEKHGAFLCENRSADVAGNFLALARGVLKAHPDTVDEALSLLGHATRTGALPAQEAPTPVSPSDVLRFLRKRPRSEWSNVLGTLVRAGHFGDRDEVSAWQTLVSHLMTSG